MIILQLQNLLKWCIIIFKLIFMNLEQWRIMEKRYRLYSLKSLTILIMWAVLIVSVCSMFSGVSAQTIDDTGNFSRLVTSNNPDYYSVFETNGDTITARGVYKNDIPVGIAINGVKANVKFHAESDGSYTAELSYTPISKGYYIIYISFESGAIIDYIMKYSDGWYFPDNTLGRLNDSKLEKPYEAAPEAAVYYISATADKNEVESALAQLDSIVNEVCGDETDDYKKAYLLNRWMADNIYYDHDAAETSVTLDTVAIYNVLDRHRTTCAGFANTYSALLEAAGIRSLNLKGAAATGEITYDQLPETAENHEFSAFWYEKQNRWVYADACWSGAGDYRGGSTTQRITYDKYFDISSEAFSLNHRIDRAEERFYGKALEVLDQGNLDAESTTEAETEASQTDSESSESSEAVTNSPVTVSSSSQPNTNNSQENGETKQNITPFVIIGLTGVFVIAAGIILAVNKRKK